MIESHCKFLRWEMTGSDLCSKRVSQVSVESKLKYHVVFQDENEVKYDFLVDPPSLPFSFTIWTMLVKKIYT